MTGDDGVVYLFLIALYTAVCLGLGWAGCEAWRLMQRRGNTFVPPGDDARDRTWWELSEFAREEIRRLCGGRGD